MESGCLSVSDYFETPIYNAPELSPPNLNQDFNQSKDLPREALPGFILNPQCAAP